MSGGQICFHFEQVSSKLSVSKLNISLLATQMMAMCWWLAASFCLVTLTLETTLAEEGN